MDGKEDLVEFEYVHILGRFELLLELGIKGIGCIKELDGVPFVSGFLV